MRRLALRDIILRGRSHPDHQPDATGEWYERRLRVRGDVAEHIERLHRTKLGPLAAFNANSRGQLSLGHSNRPGPTELAALVDAAAREALLLIWGEFDVAGRRDRLRFRASMGFASGAGFQHSTPRISLVSSLPLLTNEPAASEIHPVLPGYLAAYHFRVVRLPGEMAVRQGAGALEVITSTRCVAQVCPAQGIREGYAHNPELLQA